MIIWAPYKKLTARAKFKNYLACYLWE